jgi:preprotein translocase subunit SecF
VSEITAVIKIKEGGIQMLPNTVSFHEMYPFDYETSESTVDVKSQITTDENSKSPDEEQISVNPVGATGGGTFTKNKLFIAVLAIVGLIAITHVSL